jgi:hypothetical protein
MACLYKKLIMVKSITVPFLYLFAFEYAAWQGGRNETKNKKGNLKRLFSLVIASIITLSLVSISCLTSSTNSAGGTGSTGISDSCLEKESTPRQVAIPTLIPSPGRYAFPQIVSISCSDRAVIYYSTAGSSVAVSMPAILYDAPITITQTTTIKARAFKSGMKESDIASATYIINRVATPVFLSTPGQNTSDTHIDIFCSTFGATIRYTLDGKDPTSSSIAYNGPITVTRTTIIKARAFKRGMEESDIASELCTIATGQNE